MSSGTAQAWLRIRTLTLGEASETLRPSRQPEPPTTKLRHVNAGSMNCPSWVEGSPLHCPYPGLFGGASLHTWFLALTLTLFPISSSILLVLFRWAASWSCLSRGSTRERTGKQDEGQGPPHCTTRSSKQSLPALKRFLGGVLPEKWQVGGTLLFPLDVGTSPDRLFFLLTYHVSTQPGLGKAGKMEEHGRDHLQSQVCAPPHSGAPRHPSFMSVPQSCS